MRWLLGGRAGSSSGSCFGGTSHEWCLAIRHLKKLGNIQIHDLILVYYCVMYIPLLCHLCRRIFLLTPGVSSPQKVGLGIVQ